MNKYNKKANDLNPQQPLDPYYYSCWCRKGLKGSRNHWVNIQGLRNLTLVTYNIYPLLKMSIRGELKTELAKVSLSADKLRKRRLERQKGFISPTVLCCNQDGLRTEAGLGQLALLNILDKLLGTQTLLCVFNRSSSFQS